MIGATIKELREAQDINLYTLAKNTGLGITQIRKIEDGETSPKVDTAEKILDALGYEIDIVLKRKEGQ